MWQWVRAVLVTTHYLSNDVGWLDYFQKWKNYLRMRHDCGGSGRINRESGLIIFESGRIMVKSGLIMGADCWKIERLFHLFAAVVYLCLSSAYFISCRRDFVEFR